MNNQQQQHEYSCSNTSRVTNLLNNGNNAKYQQLQFDYMTSTTTTNNRGGVEEGGGGGADSDANLTAGNSNTAAAANFSTSTSSASSPQHLNNLQSSTYSNIYNYYYQNTQVYI